MSLRASDSDYWFPGRWVGGVSMIVAPMILLAAALSRLQFGFFFPQQLEAFQSHPVQMFTAYSLFLAGNVLLWPAVATLGHLIGRARPSWATWGCTLAMLGLFARTFHAGIDHLAFQLVRVQGLASATSTIAASYGSYHIVSALNPAIMFGWVVLAIGAYLAGVLGLLRSVALGSMAALMLGVLKGSSPVSAVVTIGLCVALIPLGISVLRDGPTPSRMAVIGGCVLTVVLIAVFAFLGQAG
jgi:hypothetical protein